MSAAQLPGLSGEDLTDLGSAGIVEVLQRQAKAMSQRQMQTGQRGMFAEHEVLPCPQFSTTAPGKQNRQILATMTVSILHS